MERRLQIRSHMQSTRILAALATGFGLLLAAEWPTDGGNPQRSNWQRNETILTRNNTMALLFLSLVYGGITFQQPNLCAVCLDISPGHGGAVFGVMNATAQAASAVSSVVFGYIVVHYGSYNAPLVPMVMSLTVGMLLWLRIDPTQELAVGEPATSLASAN